MADACHVRAERRAAWVVVRAPARPSTRCYSAGAKAAATDPAAREQHASSVHPSVQREGRTAMASSSNARLEQVNTQVVLLMERELLRYRPMDVGYDAWLACITQLITATEEAHTPSHSFRPPPSHDGDEAQGAPSPSPACGK
ncbi:hypothetical protein D1007_62122 [Hordeum vulgare]|nr:hypothetical protein D1007_62122 [Hordeum vulgare]